MSKTLQTAEAPYIINQNKETKRTEAPTVSSRGEFNSFSYIAMYSIALRMRITRDIDYVLFISVRLRTVYVHSCIF